MRAQVGLAINGPATVASSALTIDPQIKRVPIQLA